MQNKMIVVGSGLVGSLWAFILKKRGYDVEVFEKRPDPKNLTSPAGRSINLVITSRGLHGLKIAGILERILPLTVPVYGRQIHPKTGEVIYQPYGRDKSECNYSISRWDLNKALIAACIEAGVKIHFEHDVQHIDLEKKELSFQTPTVAITKNYTQVFATDGAGSEIRKSLIRTESDDFLESVEWLETDYKEIHLSPSTNGKPQLEKNALHIWPRGTHMMMGLANGDNSFTMTLYLPKQNHPFAFANLQTREAVENMFRSEFPNVLAFIPDYIQQFLQNPQGRLATVRLNKWAFEDSVALLGDAAHAIVPFFGQGMNLGFEDCTTMLEIMDQKGDDWEHVFKTFEQTQRPNANAIAEMALENFVEMRDKVGDAHFQFKKKIESVIEKNFPDLYRSRYGLITYTRTPYARAQKIGQEQARFLEEISNQIKNVEELDLQQIKKTLQTHLFKT